MLKVKRFLIYRKCVNCNKEFLAVDTNRISKKDYICHNCSTIFEYSRKNVNKKGKPTSTTFSFEFETGKHDNKILELVKYGFIACNDCTIEGAEWKSCIFYNKKSFHSVCRKIDKFKEYVSSKCGTHLHVGTEYKRVLQTYCKEIFEPLLDEMIKNEMETVAFWGRYFSSDYCRKEMRQEERYCAINVFSSVDTIEYRLLKFKNAKQYIRAADFCIDTTKYINHCIKKGEFSQEKAEKLGKNILNKYKEIIKTMGG